MKRIDGVFTIERSTNFQPFFYMYKLQLRVKDRHINLSNRNTKSQLATFSYKSKEQQDRFLLYMKIRSIRFVARPRFFFKNPLAICIPEKAKINWIFYSWESMMDSLVSVILLTISFTIGSWACTTILRECERRKKTPLNRKNQKQPGG